MLKVEYTCITFNKVCLIYADKKYSLPKLFSWGTGNKCLIANNNKLGICSECTCRVFSWSHHQHICNVHINLAGVGNCFFPGAFQTTWSVPWVTTRGPWKGFVEGMAEEIKAPADDHVIVDGHNCTNNCHAPAKTCGSGKKWYSLHYSDVTWASLCRISSVHLLFINCLFRLI